MLWLNLKRVVACVASLLIAASISLADEVTYHSARLPIDQRAPLSGNLLKISLGDEIFLVSEEEAGRRVAIRLLSREELKGRLSDGLAKQIAEQALRTQDQEVLYPALVYALRSQRPDQEREIDNWLPFVDNEAGRRCLVNALLDSLNSGVSQLRLCEATRALSQAAVNGVVPGLSDMVARIGDGCVREALALTEARIYNTADAQDAIARLKEASSGFVAAGTVLEGEVAQVESALDGVRQAIDSADLASFDRSLEALAQAFHKPASEQVDTKLGERFMLKAIESQAPELVFRHLSARPFERRNTESHRIIVSALRKLKLDAIKNLLKDEQTHAMIIRYALKDEEIRREYAALVSRAVDSPDSERQLVYQIVRLARDQAAVNGAKMSDLFGDQATSLASGVVKGFLSQGEYSRALAVAAELKQGAWPLLLSIRLALARLGVGLMVAALALLGVLIVVLRALAIKGVKLKDKTKLESKNKTVESQTEAAEPEPSVVQARPLFSPEYVDALNFFSLAPGATLAQIKNAYRALVKENHPDAKPNATEEDHTRFIKITSEYERLLELHEREGLH